MEQAESAIAASINTINLPRLVERFFIETNPPYRNMVRLGDKPQMNEILPWIHHFHAARKAAHVIYCAGASWFSTLFAVNWVVAGLVLHDRRGVRHARE